LFVAADEDEGGALDFSFALAALRRFFLSRFFLYRCFKVALNANN